MTLLYFAGLRLDHTDADRAVETDADWPLRMAARPPIVVRGFDRAGNPVSHIRAGERITTGVLTAAASLPGYDPMDIRYFWLIPARDHQGNAITATVLQRNNANQLFPPPFSFRPQAIIPAPDGRLFCLAAPVGYHDYGFGWFIDYLRVYRRGGGWIRDFPELHGGQIHDLKFDPDGNIFVVGDEVGVNRESFRKYNSAGVLQWSVSFADYNREIITGTFDPPMRGIATTLDRADDGSWYVSYIVSYASTYGGRLQTFFFLAKVAAEGSITWVRLFYRSGATEWKSDASRFTVTLKALGDRVALFSRNGSFGRLGIGQTSGSYVESTMATLGDFTNGYVFTEDGDYVSALITMTVDSQFAACVMRYANERLYVFGERYLKNPQVYPLRELRIYYKDLTLLSVSTTTFLPTDAMAVDNDGTMFRGRRVLTGYGPGTLGAETRSVVCAQHFDAVDSAGDPVWAGLAATAQLGVNAYGKLWRDYGWNLTDPPWEIDPATPAQYQQFHDTFAAYTTAHGATASGDYITVAGGWSFQPATDFWLPAADIAIAYNTPTPALALPVFLRLPELVGARYAAVPALALRMGLRLPVLRREYVGAAVAAVHRLTLAGLEWPFSTLIVRKTAFEVTLDAICPAVSEALISAVLAFTDPAIAVWSGVRFRDGAEQLEPMLTFPLTGLRYDRGGRSWSVSLQGQWTPSGIPARTRAITGVVQAATQSGRRTWMAALPDIFLNPGDTATWEGNSLPVGEVDYLISPLQAQMTVREAA